MFQNNAYAILSRSTYINRSHDRKKKCQCASALAPNVYSTAATDHMLSVLTATETKD
eukprot:m.104913 g.104913  ORF g.104913 m.104913 type:complete len:57 (+) comp9120_c0_seq1:762-932(+)